MINIFKPNINVNILNSLYLPLLSTCDVGATIVEVVCDVLAVSTEKKQLGTL